MWDFSIFYRQYTRQMRNSCLITWFCKIWPHVTSIRRAFAVHFSTAQNSKTSIDFDWKFSIKISFEVILEKTSFDLQSTFGNLRKLFDKKIVHCATLCIKILYKNDGKINRRFFVLSKNWKTLINFRFFNLFNLFIN